MRARYRSGTLRPMLETAPALPLVFFPGAGGRVEPGETDEAALARELSERLGITATIARQIARRTHHYDGYSLELVLYEATLTADAQPERRRVQDFRWVRSSEFENYRFPAADQETTDQLLGVKRT